jgi:hypothetical protein
MWRSPVPVSFRLGLLRSSLNTDWLQRRSGLARRNVMLVAKLAVAALEQIDVRRATRAPCVALLSGRAIDEEKAVLGRDVRIQEGDSCGT